MKPTRGYLGSARRLLAGTPPIGTGTSSSEKWVLAKSAAGTQHPSGSAGGDRVSPPAPLSCGWWRF